MIPSGVQVFVALTPIDMRYSFDRLAGAAKEQVGYDARGGALFVFFGKRRDAVKVLFFDGTGMCVFYKHSTAARSDCRPPSKVRRAWRSPSRSSRRCSTASA